MSKRIGNIVVIEAQEDEVCEFCGKVAECRPYGPNGEHICFQCGMKDRETTERMMGRYLFGDNDEEIN